MTPKWPFPTDIASAQVFPASFLMQSSHIKMAEQSIKEVKSSLNFFLIML
jgi:hypothetical protein